jgi:hypothetical protein
MTPPLREELSEVLHHIDATDASFACIIRDKCSSGIEFIKNLE